MQLQSLPRIRVMGLSLVAALGVAACGSSTTTTTTTQTTPSSASQAAVVQTATATVSGGSTTILTNAAGMTLYYRTSDTPTSVCSAGCAAVWPPLLLPSGTPTSSGSLPGTLAILADANGNQVAYNGHPLYNYSKDSVAGDTKGEGIGGVWHVAKPGTT
jgi:predicted lipoprotein with Yx(FWY)xxD motif